MRRSSGSCAPKRGREWIVRDLIHPFPGMRILDLGCGPAQILSFLPDDVTYVGYDMSAEYRGGHC
jgi:cyclopropane fatty-acyl-phospholipid synthase-like methyltransferase